MVTIRLPDELKARIDVVRGDVPRERWVRRALEATLSDPPTGAGPSGEKSPAGSRVVGSGDSPSPAAPPRAPEIQVEELEDTRPVVPLPKIAPRHWAS